MPALLQRCLFRRFREPSWRAPLPTYWTCSRGQHQAEKEGGTQVEAGELRALYQSVLRATLNTNVACGALSDPQDSNEPPVKKLTIREEAPEHEKYSFETELRQYVGEETVPIASNEQVRLQRGMSSRRGCSH